MPSTRAQQFVHYIATDLAPVPAARAALRSGLGRAPEQCFRMHPYLAPWLSDPDETATNPIEERAFYTIASLIAHHPNGAVPEVDTAATASSDGAEYEQPQHLLGSVKHARHDPATTDDNDADTAHHDRPPAQHRRRDVGEFLAHAARGGHFAEASTESFVRLLARQPPTSVCERLVTIVVPLRDKDIEVDFVRLLEDLLAWPWNRHEIGKRWLQHYYRLVAPAPTL